MGKYKAAFTVGLLIMVTLFVYNLQQMIIAYLIETYIPAELLPEGDALGIPEIVIITVSWLLMLIGLGSLFIKASKYIG